MKNKNDLINNIHLNDYYTKELNELARAFSDDFIEDIYYKQKAKVAKSKNTDFAILKAIDILRQKSKIKSRYWIFILITLVIMNFSWYYISCFNNVYPYTKKEWIKSSICIIIIKQVSPAFFALIEGVFRFLSFHFKSEKIFKFSKIFS